MIVSTIAIAEYCVGGDVHELPLKNIQILPFNLNHSQKTGELAKIAFQAKNNGILQGNKRVIIRNDTKLFAQADCEKNIEYYLSSDSDSSKVYEAIKETVKPNFQFINLNIPHHQQFGILDL